MKMERDVIINWMYLREIVPKNNKVLANQLIDDYIGKVLMNFKIDASYDLFPYIAYALRINLNIYNHYENHMMALDYKEYKSTFGLMKIS